MNTHTGPCPQHTALLRQSSQSNMVPDLPTPSAAIVCTDVLSFSVTLAWNEFYADVFGLLHVPLEHNINC